MRLSTARRSMRVAAVSSSPPIGALLLARQVVMALVATKTECLQLERLSLFNLDINRTMRLDDFEQLQANYI